MAYTVSFLKTAEKELGDLPKDIQRRIIRRVEALPDNPRPPDCKQLKSSEKFLRVRVGDYRVIYLIEKTVVVIVRVADRGMVYANLETLVQRVTVWRRARTTPASPDVNLRPTRAFEPDSGPKSRSGGPVGRSKKA